MAKKIIFFFLFIPFGSTAQESAGKLCSASKIQVLKSQNARVSALNADANIDVGYHNIALEISLDKKYIVGKVNTIFTAKTDITDCFFNLKNAFKVDSVSAEGKKLNFTHTNNEVKIKLNSQLKQSGRLSVNIHYQGTPPTSAFGSFTFSTHGTSRAPVISTLSESYGAPDWWPCKDDLLDKIDSSEVSINLPDYFVSISNGILKNVETKNNGTKTYTWKNSYPIAHYLISIACSNYSVSKSSFSYNNKTIPVENYIYPEAATNSTLLLIAETPAMMRFFSDTFGEYPFMREKYGHAMFPFGGGMEHQTVSSMGGFTESLMTHELAHQWFGDKITCKSWSDIFVNEAFASYSEALYEEFKYGKAKYNATIAGQMANAKKTNDALFIKNPNDENSIFDYFLTYEKGAVVLHMLRGVMGDEMFFKTLKNYMASSKAYGIASVDDFRAEAEKTSGQNLKYFFDEWVYGTSYPKYQYSLKATSAKDYEIKIAQSTLSTTPTFFTMPIDLLLKFESGTDSLITVFHDAQSKVFLLKNLSRKLNSVVFDPNNKILKEAQETSEISSIENREKPKRIFPNPTNDYFSIAAADEKILHVEIRNTSGKLLRIINAAYDKVNLDGLPAGKLLITIYFENDFETEALIKL